mgnify:CR=1 FL=1
MLNKYPDVLTVKEAREILRIGMNSMYHILQSGELKSIKIGRIYKIKKENVSSLFFNSDTNNIIEFILETTDNTKVETIVSIDKTLSMFQEFSSNEISNDLANYLYTIEKRIKEDTKASSR